MKLKGQNFRVFIGEGDNKKCVACATSCDLTINVETEDTATKDDAEKGWAAPNVTSKSWTASASSLYEVDGTGETAMTSADLLELIVDTEEPIVTLTFDITDGDKNRVAKGTMAYTGKAIYQSLAVSAAAKQNTTFTHNFTGQGKLTKVTA